MKKTEEMVLLYQFVDEKKLQALEAVLRRLQIKCRLLPENAYQQKVGYLFGMRGFRESKDQEDDDFVFPHEVMVMQNIKNKRLDELLIAMRDAQIEPIRFKAVVTPFNMFWTLRRLCETMQKEHAMTLQKDIAHEK